MSGKGHEKAAGRPAARDRTSAESPILSTAPGGLRNQRDGQANDRPQDLDPQESSLGRRQQAADGQAGGGQPSRAASDPLVCNQPSSREDDSGRESEAPARRMSPTPAQLGFSMPAEWHPHQATWLSYPSNETTFPELDPVRRAYHDMISALLPEEDVHLLIDEERVEEEVRRALPSALPQERLVCHVLPTVDVWIRDYGPNFLLRQAKPPDDQNGESRRGEKGAVGSHQGQRGRDGGRESDAPPTTSRTWRAEDHSAADGTAQTAYNDWIFNAWGEKYDDLLADNSVPQRLEPILRMPRFAPGIVMEGGSIEVDGQGTCLTTEQCLLNPNRNPHLKREEIEEYLRDFLGVRRVLWLGEGIVGDDTDGHIDDIVRFASADTIVCALEEDSADENYALLRDNLKRLRSFRQRDGKPYRIATLPMPEAMREEDGTRLPASYANFYIANGLVLVPTFDDPNDAQALQALRDVFPDRRVQGIDCRQLVRGLGTLHCVTQQQPRLPDESPPRDRN